MPKSKSEILPEREEMFYELLRQIDLRRTHLELMVNSCLLVTPGNSWLAAPYRDAIGDLVDIRALAWAWGKGRVSSQKMREFIHEMMGKIKGHLVEAAERMTSWTIGEKL